MSTVQPPTDAIIGHLIIDDVFTQEAREDCENTTTLNQPMNGRIPPELEAEWAELFKSQATDSPEEVNEHHAIPPFPRLWLRVKKRGELKESVGEVLSDSNENCGEIFKIFSSAFTPDATSLHGIDSAQLGNDTASGDTDLVAIPVGILFVDDDGSEEESASGLSDSQSETNSLSPEK